MLQLLDHLTALGPFKKVFAGATVGALLTQNDRLIIFGTLTHMLCQCVKILYHRVQVIVSHNQCVL